MIDLDRLRVYVAERVKESERLSRAYVGDAVRNAHAHSAAVAMEFSAAEREQAKEQVSNKQGYGLKGLFECATETQCELNAAVKLLRKLQSHFTYTDDCKCENCVIARELADFLSPYPEADNNGTTEAQPSDRVGLQDPV